VYARHDLSGKFGVCGCHCPLFSCHASRSYALHVSNAVTPILKDLLHSYGLLYITVQTLQQRPGTEHSSLKDYYGSLGAPEPGEPVLIVRISADGEIRFLKQRAAEIPDSLRSQYGDADLTVMELPEDEYFFFQAFRPGLFDLESQLPAFILQMALVHAYTLFENYIADVVRLRLQAHPAQVGLKKAVTVADLLTFPTREDLLASIIENEVNQVMRLPIVAILDSLRSRFGLRDLSLSHEKELNLLSLTRNCVVHNAGKVDQKLATTDSSFVLGQLIKIDSQALSKAIHMCRKFCASVDRELEAVAQERSA
jgi:hypothetical protein